MTTNRHHNAPETGALTVDEHVTVDTGRKALQALAKNFDLWLDVGRALKVLRDNAQHSGDNDRVISKTFARLREQNGFDSLDKARVSKLLKIIEHEGEVREWHQTLSPKQQREWSSPSSIMARCPVFKKDKKPKANERELKRQVEALTAELVESKAAYERARDPDLDEVIDMLVARVTGKPKKEIDAILADITRRITKPADDGLDIPESLKVANRKKKRDPFPMC